MYKVLFIVPYPELEQTVLKVYETKYKHKDIRMDFCVKQAVDIVKKLEKDNYDVVIGRGHTAQFIKKSSFNIPVIEIPITGYDVIRGIQDAKKRFSSGKIVLFLSQKENYNAQLLSEISSIDIKSVVAQDISDVPALIDEVRRAGYDTVIGGYTAKIAAEKAGINAVTISTGEEAIAQVLNETMNMLDSLKEEKERAELYQTVTEASKEGILYVDFAGAVKMINSTAQKILSSKQKDVSGRKIKIVYPYLDNSYQKALQKKESILNELIEVGGHKITFDFVPVIVGNIVTGVVITCQSVSKIQQIETQIRRKLSEKGLIAKYKFSDIIYQSSIMEETIKLAQRYAEVDSNILIVGETGTGKELMAQGIHNASERCNKPFVAVNCAAFPENLLESELFGYADGAFTGSKRGGKVGLMEQAHKGTLFLDEISELPINFQGKLLRVLQEKQVRRIGDDRVIDVDVRIIVATNKNLKYQVEKGEFRQDLLYRLDILKLYIPPLRERKEDISLIFWNSVRLCNQKFGRNIERATKAGERLLSNYSFGGNIRELNNIAERICVIANGELIDEELMRSALYPMDIELEAYQREKDETGRKRKAGRGDIAESEMGRIAEALEKTGGKKTEAARLLNMDRSTLWRKIKKYELDL